MTRPTVAVITPTHPGRLANGLFLAAMKSATTQILLPDAICVAVDNDGEGAAATRQRALDMAKTDFVAFLDSDDFWLPEHLQVLVEAQQDSDADYVYSWFKILLDRGAGQSTVLEEDTVFPPGHFLNDFDPEDPIETTITTLVRRELAQEIGFKELNRGHGQNTGEDAYFTLECVKRGARFAHPRRKTWLWRHHGGNTAGRVGKGDAMI